MREWSSDLISVWFRLTAGSLYTYPIFSSSLQSKLNFSVQQVSTTASIAILAQYLSGAYWGFLADKLGPGRVSLAAGLLFFLGYGSLSHLLSDPLSHPDDLRTLLNSPNPWNWIHATIAYSLCGIATAASFFSAITASARMFGSDNPGLSVAGPSCLTGLGPLILSFVGIRCFSSSDREDFNSSSYLAFLAVLSLIVNATGAYALHWKDETSHVDAAQPGERSALLRSSTPSPSPSQKQTVGPLRDPQGIRSFLSSPTVWLLGIAVLMSSGPAEMTIASIGAVVDSKLPGSGTDFKAKQVQLISITGTFTRLFSGWLSDRFCRSSPSSTLAAWAAACLCFAMTCFSIAGNFSIIWVLSIFTGSCYGFVFTLVPSLVATVWPLESFGRNYGIISYFFAAGSFLMTLLFGMLYRTERSNSIGLIYQLSGSLELVSIIFMILLYHKYWKNFGLSNNPVG